MKTMKLATLLAFVLGSYSLASNACIGTFYAVEGTSDAPTGYSIWTFTQDGTVIIDSSDEPLVPFSTSHGNWNIISRGFINVLSFNFSGPTEASYPNAVRVVGTFNFQRNCAATVPGQSTFSVIACPVSEGPLCQPGRVIINEAPIELTKISS